MIEMMSILYFLDIWNGIAFLIHYFIERFGVASLFDLTLKPLQMARCSIFIIEFTLRCSSCKYHTLSCKMFRRLASSYSHVTNNF